MAEDKIPGINFDLETWMKDLPSPLKEIPLIYLAIPGSHDSMTYSITSSSGLAPDAEPILHRLYPLFRGTILRWTITQSVDTYQQLQLGIRYLDLRLATKTGTEDFYFTHGLYADEITKSLQQVKDFVENHPGEVVILDFQHFYGFKAADHYRLVQFLLDLYNSKLCPPSGYLQGITLNHLNQRRQQVIIVYRHEAAHSTNLFWRSTMMPSPWPRQDKISGSIHQVLRCLGRGGGFQPNLTHSYEGDSQIRRHGSMRRRRPRAVNNQTHGLRDLEVTLLPARLWLSNLRNQCARPVLKDILPKLNDFTPGAPDAPNRKPSEGRAPVNVIIADFIEMDNALFTKTIIQLNFKLLKNTMLIYHNDHGQ
ncbi:PI-PLC X domain-containing protein 3 [Eumeta japonica]|uniref:PI-PLC X domain-containing protein 3 n=1 Tax=Eumeta variegata TaxID=151549 RepID=A0A4C1URB6_EUMVA|nr:PI-PLC X domain-containing protein 3 [Eumeta japonica]